MTTVVTARPAHRLRRRASQCALAVAIVASSGLGACGGRDGGGNGGPIPVPSETTVNTVPPGGGRPPGG